MFEREMERKPNRRLSRTAKSSASADFTSAAMPLLTADAAWPRSGIGFDFGSIAILPPEASADATGSGAQRSGGMPLEPSVQQKMETGFGHNFSDVRIFADDAAARQAQTLSASAFTVGTDIFFNAQTYEPARPEGQRLLAHELTHVVQRGRFGPAGGTQDTKVVSTPADPAEHEARAAADRVVAGGTVDVATPPSAAVSRSIAGWLEDKAEDVGGFIYDDMKAKAHLVKEGAEAANDNISWLEDKEQEGTAWLDDKAQGTPLEQLADVGKSMVDSQTQFAGGAQRAGVGLVEGVGAAAADPVDAMRGLQSLGEHLPMIPGVPNPIKAWNDLIRVAAGSMTMDEFRASLTPGASIEENTRFWKQFGSAFLGQYSEQWKQGKYADVAGHVVGDIVGQFFGGEFADAGEVSELTKTVEVVETTDVVAETTKPVEAVNATEAATGRPAMRSPGREDQTLVDFDPATEEQTRVDWNPSDEEAEQTRVDWEPAIDETDQTRVDWEPPREEEGQTRVDLEPPTEEVEGTQVDLQAPDDGFIGPVWQPEGVFELPEGSAMLRETPEAGRALYKWALTEDPLREVIIFRNTRTGEVVVGQGNRASAALDPQVWAEALPGPPGTWIAEAHYHPVDPVTGLTPFSQRFPSSTNGDFSVLEWESGASGNQARTSRIDIVVEGKKPDFTEFGYDPNAERPYSIDYPDPVNGERVKETFKTRAEYEQWYADNFPGRRADVPAPITTGPVP